MKENKYKEFPIKGWMWPFYVLGWIGVLNLLFWAIQWIHHASQDNDEKFYSNRFHFIVFVWGFIIVTFPILLLVAIWILGLF